MMMYVPGSNACRPVTSLMLMYISGLLASLRARLSTLLPLRGTGTPSRNYRDMQHNSKWASIARLNLIQLFRTAQFVLNRTNNTDILPVTPWFTPPYAVAHRAKNLYTLKPKVYHTVWRGQPRCDDFISYQSHSLSLLNWT